MRWSSAAVEAALVETFGATPARASVSFVGVEPIEVLRFDVGAGEWVYATLGMSRRPMTGAAQSVLDATGPRAELLLWVRADPAEIPQLWRQLAVLAAAPAVESVVHAPGATVDLGVPLGAPGSTWTGVVVTESGLTSVVDADGAAIALFRVVPATPAELAWARVHGGAEVTRRWREHGTDLLDPARRSVPLDRP